MRHFRPHIIFCLAFAVMTWPQTAGAQENPPRKITVTASYDVEPAAGIIMHPFPPNTPSQKIVSCEMLLKTSKGMTKAEEGHETGPFKKPILMVTANPNEKMQVVLKLDIDLYQAPGPVKGGKASLTEAERTGHTEANDEYQHDAKSFRDWMAANALLKSKKESDVQFATRLLAFMREKFIYKGPDEDYMQKKIKERGTGYLGFLTSEGYGECLGLSKVYVCVLRANGIPSRLVSGWMLGGDHHVRAEVFLDNVGWMHVELAGSITNKKAKIEDYFGRGGSYMIVMNEGINYSLPGPKGTGNVGTFDGFVFCKEEGDWEIPHSTLTITDRVSPGDPSKTKLFKEKSVWKGENMTLTVLKCNGETFQARFELGDNITREIKGTIKDGKVSWLAKDVRAVKGNAGGDNSGTIETDKIGNKIDFVWHGDNGDSGTFTLRQSKGK
jgi:hypothetical protein